MRKADYSIKPRHSLANAEITKQKRLLERKAGARKCRRIGSSQWPLAQCERTNLAAVNVETVQFVRVNTAEFSDRLAVLGQLFPKCGVSS